MSEAQRQMKGSDSPKEKSAPERGRRASGRRNQDASSEASINMQELRELLSLVRENGLAEFELERDRFRIRLRRDLEGRPTAKVPVEDSPAPLVVDAVVPRTEAAGGATTTHTVSTPVHPGAKAETAASEDQDLFIITSPIVGTFYRSPSPNAESFVKIGSHVEHDSVVCIIEAMKLMNEIQAETNGEVAKIYVENGQPVEYGQPLFGVKQ